MQVKPQSDRTEKEPSTPAGLRKEFGELPLDKKIKTLVQLEALTMYEALNAAIEKPLAVGEKVFDKFFRSTKSSTRQGQEDK